MEFISSSPYGSGGNEVPELMNCFHCGKPHNFKCSACKSAYYCSSDCQRADWAVHKEECKKKRLMMAGEIKIKPTLPNTTDRIEDSTVFNSPLMASVTHTAEDIYVDKLENEAENNPEIDADAGCQDVQAVQVNCDGQKNPLWKELYIEPSHPIFKDGELSIVSVLIELPLRVYRLENWGSLDRPCDSHFDNQRITYLMIDPAQNFFAHMRWQFNVGNCLVVREDRKPLLEQHFEGIWMYCDDILERCGNGRVDPKTVNKTSFARFWKSYCRAYKEIRPTEFTDILSPYDI